MEEESEFSKGLFGIREILADIKQVHVLLWGKEDGSFEFACLAELDTDEIPADQLGFLGNILDDVFARQDSEEAGSSLKDLGSRAMLAEDWLIFGNSKTRMNSLENRLNGESGAFRSLFDDRRFKVAMREFSSSSRGSLFGFARPNELERWVTGSESTPEKEEASRIDELPMAGVVLEFRDSAESIIVRSFVSNTEPSIGLAMRWDSFKPISHQFPPFCFEFEEVVGEAWDAEKMYETARINYERVRGPDTYEKSVEQKYKSTGLKLADLRDRTSIRYFFRYFNEDGFRRSMLIEKVDDFAAMARFQSGMMKSRDEDSGKIAQLKIYPESDPDAIVFGQSNETLKREWNRQKRLFRSIRGLGEQFRAFNKKAFADGKTIDDLDFNCLKNDGFILTNDWLLRGDVEDAIKMVDFLNGFTVSEDYCERVEETLSGACLAANVEGPFRIAVGSREIRKISEEYEQLIRNKYRRNEELIEEILSGAALESHLEGDEVECDVQDLVGYLISNSISESYDQVVSVMSKEDRQLHAALIVFSKQED